MKTNENKRLLHLATNMVNDRSSIIGKNLKYIGDVYKINLLQLSACKLRRIVKENNERTVAMEI